MCCASCQIGFTDGPSTYLLKMFLKMGLDLGTRGRDLIIKPCRLIQLQKSSNGPATPGEQGQVPYLGTEHSDFPES